VSANGQEIPTTSGMSMPPAVGYEVPADIENDLALDVPADVAVDVPTDVDVHLDVDAALLQSDRVRARETISSTSSRPRQAASARGGDDPTSARYSKLLCSLPLLIASKGIVPHLIIAVCQIML
jgi:hypothetical protein